MRKQPTFSIVVVRIDNLKTCFFHLLAPCPVLHFGNVLVCFHDIINNYIANIIKMISIKLLCLYLLFHSKLEFDVCVANFFGIIKRNF